jgi:hypothetical protein
LFAVYSIAPNCLVDKVEPRGRGTNFAVSSAYPSRKLRLLEKLSATGVTVPRTAYFLSYIGLPTRLNGK